MDRMKIKVILLDRLIFGNSDFNCICKGTGLFQLFHATNSIFQKLKEKKNCSKDQVVKIIYTVQYVILITD